MLKIFVKTRGKLFKLSDGVTIRTPRLFYLDESRLIEINSIFRKNRFKEGIDYTIETVLSGGQEKIKEKKGSYSRIRTGNSTLNLGNIIDSL